MERLCQACSIQVFLSQPYNSFHIYSTHYIPFARSCLGTSPGKLFQAFSILEDFLVGIILILIVLIVTVFQQFVELRYIGNMSPLSCVTEVKGQLHSVLQAPQKSCSLVNCSDQQFHEGQKLSPGAGVTSMELLGRSDGSISSSQQSPTWSIYCLPSSYIPITLRPPLLHFQM